MKINENIISIPPYVSTSWENVSSIRKEGADVIISLKDGSTVLVPGLDEAACLRLFELHEEIMERPAQPKPMEALGLEGSTGPLGSAFSLGMTGADGISAALAHNPEQKDGPDLPPEMLTKITQVAKLVLPDDPAALPTPEPLCNCMFCQIAKAISKGMGHGGDDQTMIETAQTEEEEEISEEELSFSEWDIKQVDDKLFEVTKKLEPNEHYRVFLGEPVGCTCGSQHCEHILAVLRS